MLKNVNLHLFLVLLCPLLCFFLSDNFFLVWIFMEVQTLSFLLLLWQSSNFKKSVMVFLLFQMLSSMLLFLFMFLKMEWTNIFLTDYLISFVLFLKMSMIPFHYWGLFFMEGLSLGNLFLFLTFMSVIPFYFLITTNYFFFDVLLLINLLFSSFFMFTVNNYKKIIFFSSIFLSVLVIMGGAVGSFNLFMFLLFSYFSVIFLLLSMMSHNDINFINLGSSKKLSFSFFLAILTLVGLPFTLGFLMKSTFIEFVLLTGDYLLVFIFLIYLCSIVMSYHYLKIMYFFFISSYYSSSVSFSMSSNASSLNLLFFLGPFLFPCFFMIGAYFFFYLN